MASDFELSRIFGSTLEKGQPEHTPMVDDWLIIKRGLFWLPNGCGYTGIRDEAGRYSHAYASARAESGVCTIMRAAEAPEFLPAAYNDLVIRHLIGQRDALMAVQKAAYDYFMCAVQDEADDLECCVSEKQHELAKTLREVLRVASPVGNAGSGS